MKDRQIKKDLARGEGNRVAEGGSLLQEGNADSDHAHVKRMTPLQTKMREIAAEPQYQADAIDKQREQRSTRLRRAKDVKPI